MPQRTKIFETKDYVLYAKKSAENLDINYPIELSEELIDQVFIGYKQWLLHLKYPKTEWDKSIKKNIMVHVMANMEALEEILKEAEQENKEKGSK